MPLDTRRTWIRPSPRDSGDRLHGDWTRRLDLRAVRTHPPTVANGRRAGDREAGDREASDREAGDREAGDREAGDRGAGDVGGLRVDQVMR
jgi:hypothetical protein